MHVPLDLNSPHDPQVTEFAELLVRYKVHLVIAGHREYPELWMSNELPTVVLPSGGSYDLNRFLWHDTSCALWGRHHFGLGLFDVTTEHILISGVNEFGEKFFEASVTQDATRAPMASQSWIDQNGCTQRQ